MHTLSNFKKSLIIYSILHLLLAIIPFYSCSKKKEFKKLIFLEKRNYTAEDSLIDLYPRVKGDAHNGNYFARTDSLSNFGMGNIFAIDDTSINKDLRVKFNIWLRSNQVSPKALFAIALHDSDKIISWQTIDLNKYITVKNKWINVIDSLTIPSLLVFKSGLIVKTFTYNIDKNLILDSDDLELVYYNLKKEDEN